MDTFVEMDVNIPSDLKSQAEMVLAQYGLTPEKGVIRIYEFLVQNQNNLELLKSALDIS